MWTNDTDIADDAQIHNKSSWHFTHDEILVFELVFSLPLFVHTLSQLTAWWCGHPISLSRKALWKRKEWLGMWSLSLSVLVCALNRFCTRFHFSVIPSSYRRCPVVRGPWCVAEGRRRKRLETCRSRCARSRRLLTFSRESRGWWNRKWSSTVVVFPEGLCLNVFVYLHSARQRSQNKV